MTSNYSKLANPLEISAENQLLLLFIQVHPVYMRLMISTPSVASPKVDDLVYFAFV